MKYFSIILVIFILAAALPLQAQTTPGFFLGGDLALFMLNGKGDLKANGDKSDFDLSDDAVKIVNQNGQGVLEAEGLSISKMLYGIRPVAGYRINSRFSVMGSYNFYLKKSGDGSDTFGNATVDAETKYTQRSLQFLGQFTPTQDDWFILAGYEFVSLSAELEWSGDIQGGSITYDGDDKTSGLLVGAGYEMPVSLGSNKKTIFVVQGLYSLTKYNGNDLLEPASGGNVDLDINVGGIMVNAGVRMYF